jgi:hypothetical protein
MYELPQYILYDLVTGFFVGSVILLGVMMICLNMGIPLWTPSFRMFVFVVFVCITSAFIQQALTVPPTETIMQCTNVTVII